jgi:hypothetical protein
MRELVDQGLAFDLGPLVQRRQLLQVFGLGALVVGLTAACGSDSGNGSGSASTSSGATSSAGEIPDETAGPYPGNGSNGPNVLSMSGIVRSDRHQDHAERRRCSRRADSSGR